MTDFVKHYPRLCDACNRTIATIASHMPDLEDTDDPEAPLNKAADNGLLCGGRTCRRGWSVGDEAYYEGWVVTLTGYVSGGGFFEAESKGGGQYYPAPEELKPIPEFMLEIDELDEQIQQLSRRVKKALNDVPAETPTDTLSIDRERMSLHGMILVLNDMAQASDDLYNNRRLYHRSHA